MITLHLFLAFWELFSFLNFLLSVSFFLPKAFFPIIFGGSLWFNFHKNYSLNCNFWYSNTGAIVGNKKILLVKLQYLKLRNVYLQYLISYMSQLDLKCCKKFLKVQKFALKNRRSLSFRNVRKHLIIQCNSNVIIHNYKVSIRILLKTQIPCLLVYATWFYTKKYF